MHIQTTSHWWHPVTSKLAAWKPISGLLVHIMHPLDRVVLRLSRGKHTAGSILTGMPIITLTTTGAKSGKPRSVPLVGIMDGENVILIASNWGQKRHPAWYHNLKANPVARITFRNKTQTYQAREVSGPEYTACWNKALSVYAGYEAYKARTGGREIPVMLLTPQK